jgi:hypothetical protein
MEIQVAVSLDGKEIKVSDNLQGLLTNLVGSFIKQTLSIGKQKVKRVKKVKDLNAPKRAPRAQWTDEDLDKALLRAKELQDEGKTDGMIAKILGKEFNRSEDGMYSKIYEFRRNGKLPRYNPNNH